MLDLGLNVIPSNDKTTERERRQQYLSLDPKKQTKKTKKKPRYATPSLTFQTNKDYVNMNKTVLSTYSKTVNNPQPSNFYNNLIEKK